MSETSPPSPLPQERGGASLLPSPPRRGVGGEVFSRGAGMTPRARSLRRTPTDAERKLWAGLRGDQLGVRFRRQLVIGQSFIADFCAPSIKLVVEVDGGQHAGSEADAARTARLEDLGYAVLRFWNNDVLSSTDRVLAVIHSWIAEQAAPAPTSPPSPLPRERGSASLLPSPLRRGVGGEVSSVAHPAKGSL